MKQKSSRKDGFARVYLAGKIRKNDWRHVLFPRLRASKILDGMPKREVWEGSIVYSGPFFVSCGHGCAHGENEHGCGVRGTGCFCRERTEQERIQARTANECIRGIDNANFIFCWIEELTAFGTIFELGYARATNKPIFVALKKNDKGESFSSDLWFCLSQAQKWIETDTPMAAWAEFTKWHRQRRKIGDSRKRAQIMTTPQSRYLKSLIWRSKGLSIVDNEAFQSLTIGRAARLIDCLVGGGNPVEEFEGIFAWDESVIIDE
jgi:nucleoside 2-deoxyribosyltransferase